MSDSSFCKVIRDPVHNLIRLDGDEGEMVLAIVQTPEFQRLRRIRQLGLSFLTYPGAEHSRLVHSLGVYWVCCRMLDAIVKKHGEGDAIVSPLVEHRKAILAAALLHDVGHGPFSHLFETALRPVGRMPTGYPRSHEDWSVRIIRERFAETLKGHRVDANVVAGMIDNSRDVPRVCKELISSQFDCDRLDYLLRDSQMCGTNYGTFDLDWLLHSVRIAPVSLRGKGEPEPRLCLDVPRASHALEQYVLARRFMYLQVYTHHATRAYEAMMTNLVGLLRVVSGGSDREQTCGDLERLPNCWPVSLQKLIAGLPLDTAEYLQLDDFQVWASLARLANAASPTDPNHKILWEQSVDLAERLLHRGRTYRYLTIGVDLPDEKVIRFETLTETEYTIGCGCQRDSFDNLTYKSILYAKHKEGEEEDQAIHVFDGQRANVAETSGILKELLDQKTTVGRFYYDDQNKGSSGGSVPGVAKGRTCWSDLRL